ncbi:MAG: 16S rRNA (guanine(527)-N(7))-methyltransferase RsmG [Cyanobacteria bacterium P01_H01_bin.15]
MGFEKALTQHWWKSLDWQPTDLQTQQFEALYEHVIAGNRQLNLTRLTSPADFWEKHLWDSVAGFRLGNLELSVGDRWLDIGTGAGFPGLVLAIVYPQLQWTLLDSTAKKVCFIEQVVQAMELPNVAAIAERAETVGRMSIHREQYTGVTLRAVAPITVCAEYALPCLREGGWAVLYRGQRDEAELANLEQMLPKLGGSLGTEVSFETPLSCDRRHGVYLRKVGATSEQYPRKVGVPARRPL